MGHYLHGSIGNMSWKMNASIIIDVVAGIFLNLFLFWSAFIVKEWHTADEMKQF